MTEQEVDQLVDTVLDFYKKHLFISKSGELRLIPREILRTRTVNKVRQIFEARPFKSRLEEPYKGQR